MGTVEMVEENCAAAGEGPLLAGEVAAVNGMVDGMQELARLYCTGCGYCAPCPEGVNIPRVFELVNYERVYGLGGYAREQYRRLMERDQDATHCVECGTCLDRCPQHIPIPEQMREAEALFAARA
jgi:predicted aldo/keto reductase-like oxidoreductase